MKKFNIGDQITRRCMTYNGDVGGSDSTIIAITEDHEIYTATDNKTGKQFTVWRDHNVRRNGGEHIDDYELSYRKE